MGQEKACVLYCYKPGIYIADVIWRCRKRNQWQFVVEMKAALTYANRLETSDHNIDIYEPNYEKTLTVVRMQNTSYMISYVKKLRNSLNHYQYDACAYANRGYICIWKSRLSNYSVCSCLK